MAQVLEKVIKLQIPAGGATPAPPVGPALGQAGINIMQFCKQFNSETQKQAGLVIPVVISVFKDKSFTFITKTPPPRSCSSGRRISPRDRGNPTATRSVR